MSENRKQILEMLSEGKISADEAERLIAALEKDSSSGFVTGFAGSGSESGPKAKAKYLRVMVDAQEHSGGERPTRVNVRVPMQLLRAGVKLAGLIPARARNHVNEALHEQGIEFDLAQIKPENLEELVEQLNDLTVDVEHKEDGETVKVKVFCE